jgi:hypothetical protein
LAAWTAGIPFTPSTTTREPLPLSPGKGYSSLYPEGSLLPIRRPAFAALLAGFANLYIEYPGGIEELAMSILFWYNLACWRIGWVRTFDMAVSRLWLSPQGLMAS